MLKKINRLVKNYFEAQNINIFVILIQIFIFFYSLQENNMIMIFPSLLLTEAAILILNNKIFVKIRYSFFLFIKYSFINYMLIYNQEFLPLFFLILFQISLYFLTDENLVIYKNKINLYLAFALIFESFIYSVFNSISSCSSSFYNLYFLYIMFYVIILFIKSKEVDLSFCKDSEDFNIDFLRFSVKDIDVSFLLLLLSFLGATLNNINFNNFSNIPLVILIIVLSFLIEYKSFILKDIDKSYRVFILGRYLPFIIFLIIVILPSFTISNIQITSKIPYHNHVNTIHTAITNIVVLNIASLFIILQLNYHKFGSSFILKMVLKSKILIITLIPSIILIFYHILISDVVLRYRFLPDLLLIISIASTVLMFFYTSYFLEVNKVMLKLFSGITKEMYDDYKKNTIFITETRFEAILKTLSKIIDNNDSETSNAFFSILSCWIYNNIDKINEGSFYENENKKFPDFFDTILDRLTSSDNLIIHENFIYSIKYVITRRLSLKNFYSYKIIYELLFKYLLFMLKKNKDELAIKIFYSIYSNSSQIFYSIEEHQINTTFYHVSRNLNLNNFYHVFVKNWNDITDLAIKNNNLEFLKRNSIYEVIFRRKVKNWDGKILDIFIETFSYDFKRNKHIVENERSFFSIESSYKMFFPYHYEDDGSFLKNKFYKQMEKYFIVRVVNMYKYFIVNSQITHLMNFNLLRTPITWSIKNRNLKTFKIYTTIYSYLIKELFIRTINENKNNEMLDLIWHNFTYSYDLLNRDDKYFDEFKEFLIKKINKLKKQFPKLEDFKKDRKVNNSISRMNILENYDI